MESVAPFILTALALAGSPGPNTLSLAAVGAAFGRARGVAYMAGLTLGMAGVIAIVGSGLAAALLAAPGVAPVVTISAALYLVYLAYKIATAPPVSAPEADAAAPAWTSGVALSLANPKAYAAMAALFSGYSFVAARPLLDGLLKAALTMGVILFVNVIWLSVGAALAGLLSDPRASRTVNIAFATALILSVAAVFWL